MVESWIAPLEAGDPESAWDLFIERYRRLIFGAIRHYTTEPDEVMDVFARVCEVLRGWGGDSADTGRALRMRMSRL